MIIKKIITKAKKPLIMLAAISLAFLLFSQTTLGKRVLLESGIIEAVRNFFAGNPELHACDYKDGTILLIKPVATGVGEGRIEAGDIAEIRDGTALCERFGDKDFLGSSEKTNFLVVYYPAKLTDEQKKYLTAPEEKIIATTKDGEIRTEMVKRRQVGIDYTKFLNNSEILKIRSFENLNKIPEIDLSSVIEKSPGQKSVVKISEYIARIENFRNTVKKIARKLIPFALAGTGGTKTICTSGCNYTTLNGWETGEEGILTEPAIAQITGGFQDTTAVTIAGWTTSATFYIKIWTDPTEPYRHNGKWDTGKYRLVPPEYNAIDNYESYVRIDGLQIAQADAYGIDNEHITDSPAEVIISNNILKGTNLDYKIAILPQAGGVSTFKIYNNIIYDWIGAETRAIYVGAANSTVYLYNNTMVDNTWGIQVDAGTVIAKNNIVKGSADAYLGDGTFAAGTDYNATDINDAPGVGSNNRVNQTFNFAGAANKDFHLRQGDSAARSNGANLTNDANLPFNTDIDNQTRPQTGPWDIGADETRGTQIGTPITKRGPQGGLVGNWTFDGQDTIWTSGTTASTTDKSGNNNTGNVLNVSKTSSPAPGISGQALKFDGVDDYVTMNSPHITSKTITAWVKFTSTDLTRGIVTNNNDNFHILATGQTAGTFATVPNSSANAGVDTVNTFNDGKWHFVAALRDTNEIYVDGVIQSTVTDTNNYASADPFIIGARTTAPFAPFTGLIDEVRIYNRALSANEVTDLYRLGAARLKVNTSIAGYGPQSGLVGHWTFDGQDMNWASTTAEALDRSGYNNHGNVTNSDGESVSPKPKSTIGINGQAIKYSGDYREQVVIKDSSSLDSLTTNITASAWVKRYAGTFTTYNWVYSAGSNANRWTFGIANTSLIEFAIYGGNEYGANTFIEDTNWHHIAMVKNGNLGTNLTFYLDGVADGTASVGSVTTPSGDKLIGNEWDTSHSFYGLIDEVRIYNRVLSASEVLELYNIGARTVKFKQ